MKTKEKEILKEIEKYIESTYEQHYSNEVSYNRGKKVYTKTEDNLQAMDIFRALNSHHKIKIVYQKVDKHTIFFDKTFAFFRE